MPVVILIGGATGVGKSTIATQLAARLGIVRVVATDAIREVMRAMLSPELMPTLHVSSFQADRRCGSPPTRTADALVLGFREQTAAVSVGINALIERAAAEGTSIVIEGAHVVPGFFDADAHGDAHPRGTLHHRGRRRRAAPLALRRSRRRDRLPPRHPVRGGIRRHPDGCRAT